MKKLIGYRVKHSNGLYVHSCMGMKFTALHKTKPVSLAIAGKLLEAWLDAGFEGYIVPVLSVKKEAAEPKRKPPQLEVGRRPGRRHDA